MQLQREEVEEEVSTLDKQVEFLLRRKYEFCCPKTQEFPLKSVKFHCSKNK